MRTFKMGLVGIFALSLVFVSCTQDENEAPTTDQTDLTIPVSQKKIPKEVRDAVIKLNLNSDYIKYDTFHFPDGTTEERLYIEKDLVLSEEQLFAMAEAAEDGDGRQYSTDNLVSQGRNISIIGYTGGSQALSSKERTALRWAVNNYNRLSGVSISFTLTFGTNYQNKDMVVYNNTVNNPYGAGGSAGFPSGGYPYKYVQIYGLSGYSTNVNEHVITHEIGHSVGFRHTDWFSRQSCGQNSNEGTAGVGANHIAGTPTGYDPTSIMLACFSSSEDGEFNSNDIKALQTMY
ncbi:zinc-dependent metalloprotease [Marixanthomonas spongiae]|uniref:Peptidase n=1 Tax=Marixanthomonas spongiae TaxID=2174845 RepID=A0A2U0I5N1_9FLAO|nr:zinc-dependent metalloprotease [Marixanthomonas spongiae]PVW16415.1 peptidase [Marixanthomonas spongiae]